MPDSEQTLPGECCQSYLCTYDGRWVRIWTHDSNIINACLCEDHANALASPEELDAYMDRKFVG